MSRRSRRKDANRSNGLLGNALFRWVLILGTLVLCLLFVGLLGLKIWLKKYRESEGFRNTVTAKVGEVLRSEVEMSTFSWEDRSVFADGFRARGYEDAAHSTLQLDGMRASFGGIADQAWQIPEVIVNRMNLEFAAGDRLPGAWAERSASARGGDDSETKVPGWIRRYVPEKFETGDIVIDAANLKVVDSALIETFGLRSVRTRMRRSPGGFGWEIEGQGGEMTILGQPEMEIERFSVRWQDRELFINHATVDFYDDAHLTGDGSIVFGTEGTGLDLELRIANLDVSEVTGPEWEGKLAGILSGTVRVEGRAGSVEGLRQSGILHLGEGVLTDLPILDKIARYTRNQKFKRLALNETTARFEKTGDRIHIRELVVQSDGLSRVEGEMMIDGENINGRFRLGVTPGTLSWIPGAERKVFVESEKGFLWTNVLVAGTLDDPREDLSARLVVAAAESIVEDVPRKAIDAARKTLENPAQAPSSLVDEGRKLLDTLVPLLPVP